MVTTSRSPGPTMRALARVPAARVGYFGFERNAICPGPAESMVATPVSPCVTSPTASPPRWPTISRSVSESAMGLLVRQRLDDLLGDVDARAREHRFLDDQVELLLLRDLVDDARRHALHRCELLVAAQVQVLADLALEALEVAADVGELPLLLA